MNEPWSNRLKSFTTIQVVRFLVGALILTSLGSLFLNILRSPQLGDEFAGWWEHWLLNMSAELGGAAVTLLILEWVLRQIIPVQQTAVPSEEVHRAQNETLLKEYVERIKMANTRERRQVVIDEMKKRELLAGANLNNLNLQGA